MVRRRAIRHDGRSSPELVLLAIVLLPALVFAPALDGVAAWHHSHGPRGGHLHVVALHTDHVDLGAHDEWHEVQQRHEHENGAAHEGDEPAPPAPNGLLIELPEFFAAAPRDPTPASMAGEPALAPLPLLRWHLAPAENRHRPELVRSGWPPQGTGRSGVAALLRSSHAIRN